jgi:hypothetical protein
MWKAVLIAPAGAPLAIALWLVWRSIWISGFSELGNLSMGVLLIFLFGLPISYAAMLLVGLPVALTLRSRGRLTWPLACIGGVMFGAVIWAGYWQLSYQPRPLTLTIPAGALIGLVVGVIFSVIAKLPSRATNGAGS